MQKLQRIQAEQRRKAYWLLTKPKRYRKTQKTLRLFLKWCKQEFNIVLYAYEIDIAWWLLASLIIESFDVFVKMARQSGKTETVTLLVRFLIIFYRFLRDAALMAAFASPKGEQAKTDVDRIKKSIVQLRAGWNVEDREFNAKTIRAYRFEKLFAEIYTFSLSPTTQNESKTLNLLIIEESHKADHTKRSDELDPMAASTGGPTWHFGVGCTVLSDFKLGCDGQLPDSFNLWIDVYQVIRDRREMYRRTGDPSHLEYEKTFLREVRKKGIANPEICRNYLLLDTVEQGNFISRERLLSCARAAGVVVPADKLFVGIDWARESDFTWMTVINDQCDVIDWFKYPHIPYVQQVEMMQADLKAKGYLDRILGVRGDDTGTGGPLEILEQGSGLPVGEQSFFKFTLQSKDRLYVLFEQALFREPGQEGRFSYPADHPLAGEFEEQMTAMLREYKGDGEYLSVHHPDEAGAHDDGPDATALALLAGAAGGIGDILLVG